MLGISHNLWQLGTDP